MDRARRLALLLLAVAGITLAAASPSPAQPTPGAAGVGDPIFPELGNGGYDVQRYLVELTYPTAAPQQRVTGAVTVTARATQELSRFNLDFEGDEVSGVTVDGAPATWARSGEELVITPPAPLADGRPFEARVSYVSATEPIDTGGVFNLGWIVTGDGSVTAAQPDAAHSILPVNDHPVDKASWSFVLDVPEGVTAVANGVLAGRETSGGRTRWAYEQRQPMAAELVQLAVGSLRIVGRAASDGTELRDVVPTALAGRIEPALARTPDHVEWMEDRVGRYPFDVYGVLAADQGFGFALETQTLSLFPAGFLDEARVPRAAFEPVMVHELAHQWFGNSVSPELWSDLWLNEGHATWYEIAYAEERFGEDVPALMREVYAQGDRLRAAFGPVARPTATGAEGLFSENVYLGGALALYALRQEVGEDAFRAIQRSWVEELEGRSAGTDDFIALASRVAGRDLTAFLREWLYGTRTPPMPGHPDWTVEPAEPGAPPAEPPPLAGALEAGRRLARR
jgi:aminopeptidase N